MAAKLQLLGKTQGVTSSEPIWNFNTSVDVPPDTVLVLQVWDAGFGADTPPTQFELPSNTVHAGFLMCRSQAVYFVKLLPAAELVFARERARLQGECTLFARDVMEQQVVRLTQPLPHGRAAP